VARRGRLNEGVNGRKKAAWLSRRWRCCLVFGAQRHTTAPSVSTSPPGVEWHVVTTRRYGSSSNASACRFFCQRRQYGAHVRPRPRLARAGGRIEIGSRRPVQSTPASRWSRPPQEWKSVDIERCYASQRCQTRAWCSCSAESHLLLLRIRLIGERAYVER